MQGAIAAAVLTIVLASADAKMINNAPLEDCCAMDTIELNLIKPRIAACRTSPVFHDATTHLTTGKADLCETTSACGSLLPYLAYMKKQPCLQRMEFEEFCETLLSLCDAFPYHDIDPKSVLVGKPPHAEL